MDGGSWVDLGTAGRCSSPCPRLHITAGGEAQSRDLTHSVSRVTTRSFETDRPIVHHRAIVCGNRSKVLLKYRYLSIFQDDGHPSSWICWTHFGFMHEEYFMAFRLLLCKICFEPIKYSFKIECHAFGLKTPIHALRVGVCGIWHTKGEQCQCYLNNPSPKRHILQQKHVVWHIDHQNLFIGLGWARSQV